MILLGLTAIVGCQTGHCRRTTEDVPEVQLPEDMAKGKAEQQKSQRKIEIFKYDGSLQCNQGKTIELKAMAQGLEEKKIKVYSMKKKADGLMHIQVCGSPTGYANVYEIFEADLEKAKELGFKKWTFYD